MYSPFVMVLGNLISGVLFLLDEYTTSVHDYLSILTGCSLIFFPQFVCNIIRYKLCIAKCWKPKRTVPEGAIYVHYKTMQELRHCERD